MTNGENTNGKPENVECISTEAEFIESLKKTNSAYLGTVIISAAIVAAGVAVAAFLNVFAGLALGIVAILLYMFTTKQILNKNLGIFYRSTSGELAVVSLKARGKEEIFIPHRLLWLDVTEIDSGAFNDGSAGNMHTIHLPATLKVINESAFDGCGALTTICFEGSAAEWDAIEKSELPDGIEIKFFDSAAYEVPKEKKASEIVSDLPDSNTPSDGEGNDK